MASFEQMFQSTNVKKPEAHQRRETKWLHYTKLVDNMNQYRTSSSPADIEALAGLIEAEKGVLQNLLVRKIGTDEYEIIAGHHRKKACTYLVEEKGMKEYEFLPCTVENMNDIRAEFQLYSSNGFVPKNDYERMHELEKMRYLIETYPEEFPHLQTGRMVERLAAQLNMKKTTVGEYLTISKNLGEKGKEAFKEGTLNKSAALELARLPEEKQDQLIDQGVTTSKDIRKKKEVKEPSDKYVRIFYETHVKKYDTDRDQLKDWLKEHMGRSHAGGNSGCNFQCSLRGIKLEGADEITWSRFVQRINELFPRTEAKQEETSSIQTKEGDAIEGQMGLSDYPGIVPKESETVSDTDVTEAEMLEEEIQKTLDMAKKYICGHYYLSAEGELEKAMELLQHLQE